MILKDKILDPHGPKHLHDKRGPYCIGLDCEILDEYGESRSLIGTWWASSEADDLHCLYSASKYEIWSEMEYETWCGITSFALGIPGRGDQSRAFRCKICLEGIRDLGLGDKCLVETCTLCAKIR